MKCVVTGATGHIGSALVRELLRHDWDVTALVMEDDGLEPLEGLDVRIAYGDVCRPDTLAAVFEGQEVVFHLAGMVSISSLPTKALARINVGGTQAVIAACRICGVRRIVYVSSVHALEELPDEEVIREAEVFDPVLVRGAYAKTKALSTDLVLKAFLSGLDAVVVHPSGVIGPYEFKLSSMGQLFIDSITKGVHFYVEGAYDWVDVRDAAAGIRLAAEKGMGGECYILSGTRVPIRQLLSAISRSCGKEPPKGRLPLAAAYALAPAMELFSRILGRKPVFTIYSIATLQSNSRFCCEKARRELGYQTRPFDETIRDTVAWLKEHYHL